MKILLGVVELWFVRTVKMEMCYWQIYSPARSTIYCITFDLKTLMNFYPLTKSICSLIPAVLSCTRIINCVDILWDDSLRQWIYSDNRVGFPLEADRHYLQQRRLWTEDNVDFELGGTSNVAANETSKRLIFLLFKCFKPVSFRCFASQMWRR